MERKLLKEEIKNSKERKKMEKSKIEVSKQVRHVEGLKKAEKSSVIGWSKIRIDGKQIMAIEMARQQGDMTEMVSQGRA